MDFYRKLEGYILLLMQLTWRMKTCQMTKQLSSYIMLEFTKNKHLREKWSKIKLNIPKAFNEGSVCRQQNFSDCKPQWLSQLSIWNSPLSLPLMKLFKLCIEYLQPDNEKQEIFRPETRFDHDCQQKFIK